MLEPRLFPPTVSQLYRHCCLYVIQTMGRDEHTESEQGEDDPGPIISHAPRIQTSSYLSYPIS